MNSTFETQFEALETSRKNLFKKLAAYSNETLNRKPSPEAWSVVQVIEHLMVSEEASLKYLQKKTLDISKAQRTGFKNKWKLLLTKAVFYLPFKFKAPASMVPMPSEALATLNELDSKWAKTRADMFQLISKLQDADMEKELWKHVVSGKMNLYQMVDFFDFHFKRHLKQIERTIEQVT